AFKLQPGEGTMAVRSISRWAIPNLDMALLKRAKAYSTKQGAQDFLVSQIFTGPFTGQYLVAAVYSDMAAYRKAVAANHKSADYKKLMADTAKTGAVLHERTVIMGVDL